MENKISQQILIYDRLKETYNSLCEANKRLEGKALLLAANSSFITGLLASSGVGTESVKGFSALLIFIISLACLFTVFVYFKGASLITPKFRSLSGTLDLDRLQAKFVQVDETKAYYYLMKDLTNSIKDELESNGKRAAVARSMVFWVEAQAIAVVFYFIVKLMIVFA